MPPDDPTPATPAPGPKADAAVKTFESFQNAMQRLGGFGDEEPAKATPEAKPETKEEPAEATEAKTEPEADPKAEAGKKKVVEASPDRAKFDELAKKLGFKVEGGEVTWQERAEFRDWKRKAGARLQEQEKQLVAKLSELKTSTEEDVKWAKALRKAAEDGDYQAIAVHVGAKDWNELEERAIARIADPNYKRLRELEQWQQEQSKREEQTKAEQARQDQARARAEAQRAWQTELVGKMKESAEPLLQELHDDPMLAQAIMRVQGEHYDPTTQSTVSPEQAMRIPAKGAALNLHDELERLYGKLHKVFGKKPETAKPAPKTEPKPMAAPAKWAKLDDEKEFRAHFHRTLGEAVAQEAATARKRA